MEPLLLCKEPHCFITHLIRMRISPGLLMRVMPAWTSPYPTT
uniref:Uncharacterized protein n=1 Tax=Corynebacterium phage HS01 TaxID=3056389 RepID=A0AA49X1U2_9VIRU|nr:MAG: hypothetical protein [Corynebacterium phage HS01]